MTGTIWVQGKVILLKGMMTSVWLEGRVFVALGRLFTFSFHLRRRLSSRNSYYYRFLWHHLLITQLSGQ